MKSSASRQGGFSLLETVAAALVLGVGTLALTRAFVATQREMNWTRAHTTAAKLTSQRLADLSTRASESIPACAGVPGCRETRDRMAAELAMVGGFPCTQHAEGEGVLSTSPGSTADRFRVDTVVVDPPDLGRFPTARIATVSVCWVDQNSTVQEVQSQQVLLSEE